MITAQWSSGSTSISSSESDDSRALMIFEKTSSFICSAAIPRWLQILFVGMVEVVWYAKNEFVIYLWLRVFCSV